MLEAAPLESVEPSAIACATPAIEVRDLGRMRYGEALEIQKDLVERRKQGLIPDQLLFVEHPHVITQGRNGKAANLLASEEALRSAGIEFYPTNRGGDITYHGPGQIVGYPILDLREWKRDVVAYVRAIEQAILDALAGFGITAGVLPGCTGVWVDGKKVAAIGVHISRWVTSHGFALNHTTDLRYFQYIVPCGLTKPVTSMQELGSDAGRDLVIAALATSFACQFQRQPSFGPPDGHKLSREQPSRDQPNREKPSGDPLNRDKPNRDQPSRDKPSRDREGVPMGLRPTNRDEKPAPGEQIANRGRTKGGFFNRAGLSYTETKS